MALAFVEGRRVGCMLAGFLLNREPFFRGKDNEDQLLRIALVLGTQGLFDFLRKYGKGMNWVGGKPQLRDRSKRSEFWRLLVAFGVLHVYLKNNT